MAVFNKNLDKTVALLTHTDTGNHASVDDLHYKYTGSHFLRWKNKEVPKSKFTNIKKKKKKKTPHEYATADPRPFF